MAAVSNALVGDPEPCVLLSGGLDSSLVAWTVRQRAPRLVACVIGTPNAPDLRDAADAAQLMGIPLESCLVDREDVERVLRDYEADLSDLREPARSVMVATILALSHAPRRLVLCGQGADELFLGYAHFRELHPQRAEAVRGQDWSRLVESMWPRTSLIGERLGKRIRSPYLDPSFAGRVREVPTDDLLPRPIEKSMLREIGRVLGLPERLVSRPKRAWQYGSGIHKVVKALSRSSPASMRR